MEEKWVSQLCICFPGRAVFANRWLLQQVKKKKQKPILILSPLEKWQLRQAPASHPQRPALVSHAGRQTSAFRSRLLRDCLLDLINLGSLHRTPWGV